MALDPSDAAGLPGDLIRLYSDAEIALIAMLADAIAEGIDTPEWLERQPAAMLRFRRQAEALAAQLQTAMPPLVTAAVAEAAAIGAEAADADVDEIPDAPPKPPDRGPDPRTRARQQEAWHTIATVTQRLPGIAGALFGEVVGQTQVRNDEVSRSKPAVPGKVYGAPRATPEATRLEAAQQALDILTKRGITGFKDSRGRNWSLSSYIEMKSRTIVNQELIDSHTQRMRERGQNLLVVSSHKNPAPQCQPFEGQVLSLNGETGTVLRPSAVGGPAVKVKIKATLEEARAKGFQHPNCRHAVTAFVPGASKTFTTKPNPEGYEATQKQRALERALQEAKRRQAVAVTPAAKREAGARVKALQAQIKAHVAANDLPRRPRRESIAAEHRFGRPGDPGNPTPDSPRGPTLPPEPPTRTGGGGGGDDGEPPRRMPFGRRVEHGKLGNLGADEIDPPSYRLLRDSGLIATDANPTVYHSEKERYTTDWLTRHGVQTYSVNRRTSDGEKTPDSVFSSAHTLELKMLERPKGASDDWAPGGSAVARNIRNARKQSRTVVVDGRRSGLAPDAAEKGLREALNKYGAQLDEVLIIFGDGPDDAISWSNG